MYFRYCTDILKLSRLTLYICTQEKSPTSGDSRADEGFEKVESFADADFGAEVVERVEMGEIKPKVEKDLVDELLPRQLLLRNVFDRLLRVFVNERHEHPMIGRSFVSWREDANNERAQQIQNSARRKPLRDD